jgi:hypothetical protein
VSETKELLRPGVGDFEPTPDALERVLVRRDRRRRNQRVAAGVVGIAIFALVAFGFVRLLGSERGQTTGPATSSPPTASSSPVTQPSSRFTETFESPLNGLSIGYPSGWRTRAATEPWGGKIAFDAPDVDVIFDPKLKEDLYLAVVSEPLGPTAAGAWILDHYDHEGPNMGVCYSGGAGGIGNGFQGNPAWFQDCYEPHGEGGHIVIFATATRGYVIYLHDLNKPQAPQKSYGHWFHAILETVVLSEDAFDMSSPSASP